MIAEPIYPKLLHQCPNESKRLTRKDRTISACKVYTIPRTIEGINGVFECFLDVLVVLAIRLVRNFKRSGDAFHDRRDEFANIRDLRILDSLKTTEWIKKKADLRFFKEQNRSVASYCVGSWNRSSNLRFHF